MKFLVEDMQRFATDCAKAVGMNEKDASVFGESLTMAQMRGQGSHGLLRLDVYMKRLREGLVNANAEPKISVDGGSLISIDGDNGMGVCVAQQAIELCMERAKTQGVCMAAVHNCNHFGFAAYFTDYAARNHMLGFAVANSPKIVAPFGGTRAMFGTNPFALSIPTGDGPIYSLDMATSLVAQGKIILAKKEGHSVPEGWGLDANGNPSTDPNEILSGGTLTPFGGAKGYGLIMGIEMLCACLAGGAKSTTMGSMYDHSRPQGTGFVIGVINPGVLMDASSFEQSAAELVREVKDSPRRPGVEEIYMPGEIEHRKMAESAVSGIELAEPIVEELSQLGLELKVAFPQPVD